MSKITKAQQLNFLREQLTTNARWTERALLHIFEAQTAVEQRAAQTNNFNGIGFTKSDARFLTSCARFVLANGHLTAGQLPWVMKRMGKYARQLMNSPAFDEEKMLKAMSQN